jgi:hypothetical protein
MKFTLGLVGVVANFIIIISFELKKDNNLKTAHGLYSATYDVAIVLAHVYVVIHCCVSVWSLKVETYLWIFSIVCLCLCQLETHLLTIYWFGIAILMWFSQTKTWISTSQYMALCFMFCDWS